MANVSGLKDDTSIEFNHESSDSSFEIKIKTLDLQTHSFRVNSNMAISALKEEIVTKIGVPLERQKLLYKGRVPKDDKLLSELNLEDGGTMYLVERQTETSSNQGVGIESSQNTNNIHSDNPPTNIPRISLNRALTSVPFARMPALQNENEPTLVPNALTTISEYIDRMERSLQRNSILLNADRTQMVWMHPRADDLLDTRDTPTPEYLSFVLNRTEHLLRNNVITAISNLSTRLQRIDSSSNPVLRSQIQYGARRLGIALHKLGAMLLELGRVTMCLHMGETSEESFVRSGPAAYISRSGPDPTMIQLHPLLSTLAWDFNPVRAGTGQFVPTHSASQVLGSTASRGDQHHEPGSPRALHSGSESGSVEQQASNLDWENPNKSFSSLSASEISRIINATMQTDSIAQNSSNQLVQQRQMDRIRMIQDLVPQISEDIGRILGGESEPQPESSDVMTSASESQLDCNYLVDLGQAVERIEQNGDPRSIFGALLEISVRLHGEQNAYQGIVELENNEELANEFMEILRRDIRRRLAKESSSVEKS